MKPYPYLYPADVLIGWMVTKGETGAAAQMRKTLSEIRSLPETTIDTRWEPGA